MTERWCLAPTATVQATFARTAGVTADTSLPISLFVPPASLAALQRLAAALQSAWRTVLTAAVSRGQLPATGPVREMLEAIAREMVREPDIARVVRIASESPFALAPVAALQDDTIHYPIERISVFRDLVAARVPPVRAAVPAAPGALAAHGRLLGELATGMTSAALRALPPALASFAGALQLGGLLVPAPAQRLPLAPGRVAHLGHATLLANLGGAHVLVDPWFPPASAGDAAPPRAIATLPPLAAILITHHHWDHVHPDTLLQLPKDVPIYVPAQRMDALLRPRTEHLLAYLGFTDVRTVAPGEVIPVGEGGEVVAAPFYGEDPTRLRYQGCCYVLRHAGRSALVHVDSSRDVDGHSLVTRGDAEALVARYGPLDPVYATRRQERGLAIDHTWDFVLQPSSTWLEPTENCCNDAADLAALAHATQTRRLVLYSEGGADWYPDGTDFLRRATPTARALPFEYLWDSLETITAAVANGSGARVLLSRPGDELAL